MWRLMSHDQVRKFQGMSMIRSLNSLRWLHTGRQAGEATQKDKPERKTAGAAGISEKMLQVQALLLVSACECVCESEGSLSCSCLTDKMKEKRRREAQKKSRGKRERERERGGGGCESEKQWRSVNPTKKIQNIGNCRRWDDTDMKKVINRWIGWLSSELGRH